MTSDLRGRSILITGANAGIGLATARALAARGAHLVLACRSEERTRPILDDLRARTGNPEVHFEALDLADLASVRACAERVRARPEPLHVLVNNAGLASQRGQTRQGFELAFGVNHLGHFLLTTLLLDKLRAAAPARVVVLASNSHYRAKRLDFAALRRPTATYAGVHEYEVAKLCNVLFAAELGRRLEGSGVTTYAVHPGVIATDIFRRIPWPIRPLFKLTMKSPEEGARTSVRCATAPELADETGRYYASERERPPSALARDPELARRLWELSEEWTR